MALLFKRRNGGEDITAHDDAIMYYMMLGDGALDGVYGSFKATYADGYLTVQPGIFLFGGRVVEIEKGSPLRIACQTIERNGAGYVMLRVTVASDDSNSSANITDSATDASTGTTPASGEGVHRVALFHVSVSTGTVTELFDRIEPGIAKSCKNLLSGGYVNGVPYADVFDDSGACLHALEATTADEADGFVGSRNKVNAGLYMPERGVYLLQQADLLTGASIALDSGEEGSVSFADSNSLSAYLGIVAVYAGTDGSKSRVDYGGASVEQGQAFAVADGLEAIIRRSDHTVAFRNASGESRVFSDISMSVLLYGGA